MADDIFNRSPTSEEVDWADVYDDDDYYHHDISATTSVNENKSETMSEGARSVTSGSKSRRSRRRGRRKKRNNDTTSKNVENNDGTSDKPRISVFDRLGPLPETEDGRQPSQQKPEGRNLEARVQTKERTSVFSRLSHGESSNQTLTLIQSNAFKKEEEEDEEQETYGRPKMNSVAGARLFRGAINSALKSTPPATTTTEKKPLENTKESISEKVSVSQRAKELRETVITFQSKERHRLFEHVHQIHLLTELTEINHDVKEIKCSGISWARLSHTSDRYVMAIRYAAPEIAKKVRQAIPKFDATSDFEYTPDEVQLSRGDLSPFGRQVFRNERTLDELLDRDGYPGFIALWEFILTFSVEKLGRGLDFYLDQWRSKQNKRHERNLGYLLCDGEECISVNSGIIRASDFE